MTKRQDTFTRQEVARILERPVGLISTLAGRRQLPTAIQKKNVSMWTRYKVSDVCRIQCWLDVPPNMRGIATGWLLDNTPIIEVVLEMSDGPHRNPDRWVGYYRHDSSLAPEIEFTSGALKDIQAFVARHEPNIRSYCQFNVSASVRKVWSRMIELGYDVDFIRRSVAVDRQAELGQEFDAASPQSTKPPISVDLDEKSQRKQ